MLKTNNKKAINNLKIYIINHCDFSDYDCIKQPKNEDFKEYAKAIYQDFIDCAYSTINDKKYFNFNEFNAFIYYMSGLPSHGLGDYYCGYNANNILGDILEESEEERNRYSKDDSEKLLTYLIYRTIKKVIKII